MASIESDLLASLLRSAGYRAAAAAEQCGETVGLSVVARDELVTIYAARREHQGKAGRPGVAAQLDRVVAALTAHRQPAVAITTFASERRWVVFLTVEADSVLAVVRPPRDLDGSVADVCPEE